MKIVYIAHPIGGDVENNLKDLARIIRAINLKYHDVVPLAPYYADIIALYDSIPSERERGIKNDMAILESGIFKELWLTGEKISYGMSQEIEKSKELGIPIVNYINLF